MTDAAKRIERVSARINKTRNTGGKALWYMVLVEAVMDMIADNDGITREELRSCLEKRREDNKDSRILKSGYDEAIEELSKWKNEYV